MIKIEERLAEKLSGLTSLFISFDYNENIVSWLKQNLDVYNYNKKTKEWETTILELSKLLDSLCFYDEINLSLYKSENQEIKQEPNLNIDFKLKPYEHQLETIRYGIDHNKWLMLLDMGLGKSMCIIHLARWLKKNKNN